MVKKMVTAIVSMSCLTVLESIALLTGVDGVIFVTVIGAIAGLGGYLIGKKEEEGEESVLEET